MSNSLVNLMNQKLLKTEATNTNDLENEVTLHYQAYLKALDKLNSTQLSLFTDESLTVLSNHYPFLDLVDSDYLTKSNQLVTFQLTKMPVICNFLPPMAYTNHVNKLNRPDLLDPVIFVSPKMYDTTIVFDGPKIKFTGTNFETRATVDNNLPILGIHEDPPDIHNFIRYRSGGGHPHANRDNAPNANSYQDGNLCVGTHRFREHYRSNTYTLSANVVGTIIIRDMLDWVSTVTVNDNYGQYFLNTNQDEWVGPALIPRATLLTLLSTVYKAITSKKSREEPFNHTKNVLQTLLKSIRDNHNKVDVTTLTCLHATATNLYSSLILIFQKLWAYYLLITDAHSQNIPLVDYSAFKQILLDALNYVPSTSGSFSFHYTPTTTTKLLNAPHVMLYYLKSNTTNTREVQKEIEGIVREDGRGIS